MTERRTSDRIGKIATGEILIGRAVIDCAILDLSDGGARLELSTANPLPSDFTLMLTDGSKRQCKVVWRGENEVGVEFC